MNKRNFTQYIDDYSEVEAVTPEDYHIPYKIGDLKIRKIGWNDFRGKVNPNLPYSAHVFWRIDYDFIQGKKGNEIVTVDVKVLPKSWVLQQNKNEHLLRHEYGHYLLGCLCALDFERKINHTLKMPVNTVWRDWVQKIFRSTLEEYLKLQKMYDDETNHRLNFNKQEQWERFISKQMNSYKQDRQKTKLIKDNNIHKLPRIKQTVK